MGNNSFPHMITNTENTNTEITNSEITNIARPSTQGTHRCGNSLP